MHTSLDSQTSKKLEAFRLKVASDAEEIIYTLFPAKTLELQKIIDSASSSESPFHESHALKFTDTCIYPTVPDTDSSGQKKRKRADGTEMATENGSQNARFTGSMLANKNTRKLHQVVKNEAEILADYCHRLKLWVNLTMPKIEPNNGHDFGVQIQEEVLGQIHRALQSSLSLRDNPYQHHLNRAKICSKVLKYPHVEDYTFALIEHDEKTHCEARQYLKDIRSLYAVLMDIIHKNIDKICAPNAVALHPLYR